jgi:DNA-binding MarR family transcriptional regulator
MTAPDSPQLEAELDALIHAPVRLKLVVTLSALAPGDSLTFPRLQDLLNLTPGNLVTHLRKLEQGGYVETHKTSHRKVKSTSVRLTAAGRAAFETYTRALSALLVPVGVISADEPDAAGTARR